MEITEEKSINIVMNKEDENGKLEFLPDNIKTDGGESTYE